MAKRLETTDSFKRYMEAEISEILASMDDATRENPEACALAAMEWVQKNAGNFRNTYLRRHRRAN